MGSMISYLACILISLAAGIAVAFPLGIQYRKKVAEAELGTAEEEAKRIISDAIKDAEVKKKEALVEAKDEIHKQRNEVEKEVKERRNEVQRLERRIQQKEESIDRKMDNLEKKEDTLQNRIKEAEAKLREATRSRPSSLRRWKRFPATPQSRPRSTCFPTWKTSWCTRRRSRSTPTSRNLRTNPSRRPRRSSPPPFRSALPIMSAR